MKYIQHNCFEGKGIDLRQAEAVLRHKPDLIIREAPNNTRSLGWASNNKCLNKRMDEVTERRHNLQQVAKKYPWVKSDIHLFNNVVKLWKEGHDISVFDIDGPSDLLRETVNNKWNKIKKPRKRGIHFPWWVYIYLRERIMANDLALIEKRYKNKEVLALIAMEKFHWLHAKFLLKNPSNKRIFNFYFTAFNDVTEKNITEKVKNINNFVLTKYWHQVSDFC